MTDLNDDIRWRRFNDRGFECPCCGKNFNGVFDVAFDHPDAWPHGNRGASGKDRLVVGAASITSDFCRWEGQGFIRCVMVFPIIGTGQTFAFGVWGSAAPDPYDRYRHAFNSDDYSDFDGCFSWLANGLPVVGSSDHVACTLRIPDPQKRPELEAQDPDAPVGRHQRSGITFDQLLDIYSAVGDDIRPHLLDA